MATLLRAAARRTVKVNGPQDRDLALLWGLARRKFEARHGVEPAQREDWAEITADYNALTGKQRAALGTRLRERCADQPGAT